MESLLNYFNKIKHANNNRKLVSTIFNYYGYSIVFYYYQGSLFDVSIHLWLKRYSKEYIAREEKFTRLKTPLNSSILSKTLEEGLQIKQLIFINTDHYYEIEHPVFHISFSANTLTIDWYKIEEYYHLKYLNTLLELWPGLILILKNFKFRTFEYLDQIQRLLIYCKGSPLCCKLSFSKVVINIDIDEIDKIKNSKFDIDYFVKFNKLKHLCDSLLKIYDVEFENITYEDLFINGF